MTDYPKDITAVPVSDWDGITEAVNENFELIAKGHNGLVDYVAKLQARIEALEAQQ